MEYEYPYSIRNRHTQVPFSSRLSVTHDPRVTRDPPHFVHTPFGSAGNHGEQPTGLLLLRARKEDKRAEGGGCKDCHAIPIPAIVCWEMACDRGRIDPEGYRAQTSLILMCVTLFTTLCCRLMYI